MKVNFCLCIYVWKLTTVMLWKRIISNFRWLLPKFVYLKFVLKIPCSRTDYWYMWSFSFRLMWWRHGWRKMGGSAGLPEQPPPPLPPPSLYLSSRGPTWVIVLLFLFLQHWFNYLCFYSSSLTICVSTALV